MTIEEAQERMREYGKKAEEHPEKADIYREYIKNLSNYVYNKISAMSQEEFTEYVHKNMPKTEKTDQADIEKALNELANDTETAGNPENEVQGTISGDSSSTTNEESGDDETVGRELSDIHEERTVSQSDLLVERPDSSPTVMDEYVSFTEE